MRLFVGVDFPKGVKDELSLIQKQINSNLAKIKWVAKKNLHLTLKFLGEVELEKLEQIKTKLKNINFTPFEVRLSKLNLFPDWNNPKTIWVGLLPEENVSDLQKKIDAELLSFFKFDQRFIPHLTLGRVKFVKRRNLFLNELKNVSVNDKKFELNNFKLIKSTLNKDGPVYEILESFYQNY